jgi:prepilin-type N-terminal cleavage/methylation domain-containing protein
MTRRNGLSLTEVLVALFIMAIGLIAILTMFPLGALQMGQALKDDRTAQSASNADGYIRWYWREYVLRTQQDAALANALNNPNATKYDGTSPAQRPQAFPQAFPVTPVATTDPGPSYPVVVDPMGEYRPWNVAPMSNAQQFDWVGGMKGPGFPMGNPALLNHPTAYPPQVRQLRLPRRNLALVGSQGANAAAYALRTCSLLDGMGYDSSGAGVNPQSSQVERDKRYNWLWVLQRPSNKVQDTVGVTVVVFEKRAHQYVPKNINPESVFEPYPYQPVTIGPPNNPQPNPFRPITGWEIGETKLQFVQGQAPPVQKGGWICDVTWSPGAGPQGGKRVSGIRNCNFYRVVSVTDYTVTAGNPLQTFAVTGVELQSVLKPDSMSPANPVTGTGVHRLFLYMDGVAEVFERAPVTKADPMP